MSALLFDVPDHLKEIAIHYFVDEMSQQEMDATDTLARVLTFS